MKVPLEKLKHFTWELDIWRQVCRDPERLLAFEVQYVVPRERPEILQAKKEERARRKEAKAEKRAAEAKRQEELLSRERKYKILKEKEQAAKVAKREKAKKAHEKDHDLQKNRKVELEKLTALKGTPQFTEEDQARLTKLEDLKRRRAESIKKKRQKQSNRERDVRRAKRGLPPLEQEVPEEALPAPPAAPAAPAPGPAPVPAPVVAPSPEPRRRRREVSPVPAQAPAPVVAAAPEAPRRRRVQYFPFGIEWDDLFPDDNETRTYMFICQALQDDTQTEEEIHNNMLEIFGEDLAEPLATSRRNYLELVAAEEEAAASTDSDDRAMEQDLFGSDEE